MLEGLNRKVVKIKDIRPNYFLGKCCFRGITTSSPHLPVTFHWSVP